MNNWQTIAAVALALSLILPSLAFAQERAQDVTGQVVGMDSVRGVLALLTEHGPWTSRDRARLSKASRSER